MRRDDVGTQVCSVARALGVVGDRWTLLLLRDAFAGVRRSDGFQRGSGASRTIVADRLGRLVEEGVLERRAYQERPPRYEYELTSKGRDLHPVILSLMAWGDRWLDRGRGRPVDLVHRDCGRVTTAQPACSTCGEPLGPESLHAQPGPAVRASRGVRSGSRH